MPSERLSEVLGQQYEELLLRQAETIRDWPVRPERREHAEIHVRLALWEQTMGRISQDVLYDIYSTLSFIMPNDAAIDGQVSPLPELAREAEWEAAYHQQLARRSCPDCGDDVCPVHDRD